MIKKNIIVLEWFNNEKNEIFIFEKCKKVMLCVEIFLN